MPELTIFPFTESLAFGATRNPWSLDHTAGRLERRDRRRRGRGHGRRRPRLRRRRLDPHPGGLLRPVRHQAPARPHLARAQARGVARPRRRRAAGAARGRRRAVPRGDARAAAASPRRPRASRGACGSPSRPSSPPGVLARLGRRAARRGRGAPPSSLRSLGHEVAEREIDYGPAAWPNLVARYLRGIHDDARGVRAPRAPRAAHARDGAARARSSRPGRSRRRAPPRRPWPRASTRSSTTPTSCSRPGPSGPPFRVGQFHGRGALWTLNARRRRGCRTTALFNVTGQPAASVPAGFDAAGLPLAVQLVGRPRRRGDAALARRPDRAGAAVGRPPPAAVSTDDLLDVAVAAARASAAVLLELLRARACARWQTKSTPTDLVSEADLEAERAIRERARRAPARRRDPGGGGRRRAGLDAGCAGSSTRSTAPSTTCSGSRSGACRWPARARSA